MDINNKIEEIANWMESASILDLKMFQGVLESRLGVKAQTKITPPATLTYSVILNYITRPDVSKIPVIKELREMCRTIDGLMGLKAAKDMSESIDVVVKKDLSLNDAMVMKSKLEAAGAVVTVKTSMNMEVDKWT